MGTRVAHPWTWHLVAAVLLATGVACQGEVAGPDDHEKSAAASLEDSAATLGFESAGAWTVKGGSTSSTNVRTQGKAALAVANPKNLFKATSAQVDSKAPALEALKSKGAFFLVDIFLPTQLGTPSNAGSLTLFIDSKARKIDNVNLGKVTFEKAHLGTFRTVKFSIPDAIREQLMGGPFSDLTFDLSLSMPGNETGTYLLDNLRARAFGLAQPGIGQAVDLVAQRTQAGASTPGHAKFDAGVVQIPKSFHVKLGSAGTGTTQLALGFGGPAFVTCTYTAAAGGTAYDLSTCTGGFQAGELVGASEATLTIVSAGPAGAKIRAQLALNPVGDLAGNDIIPPMPTWWGECVPLATPVCDAAGCQVCDPSSASKIATDYFNLVAQNPPSGVKIKAPPGEFALRSDDGSPHDNLTGPPPPNDPPYDQEGHLNEGGDWDAYWRFQGNVSAQTDATTHNNRNQLSAELAVRTVVWGRDLNAVSLGVEAFSDSGQITTEGFTKQNSGGSVKFKIFGITIASGDKTFQSGGSFNYGPSASDDYDLPPIQIWIFSITIGVHAEAGAKLSGNVNPLTIGIDFQPSAQLSAHIEGGVNAGIAKGTVSTEIDLIKVATPFKGHAIAFVSTAPPGAPGGCRIGVNMAAFGKLELSTLGGKVELKATFGVCPFCYEDEWTLFKWDGVELAATTLFDLAASLQTDLPAAVLCLVDLEVSIDAPTAGSSVPYGIPFSLASHAIRPATPGTPATPIDCGASPSYNGTYVWAGSNAADQFLDPATGQPGSSVGCSPLVTFAPTLGPRTLTLAVTDQFGEADTKQVTFNVVAPAAGPNPFITAILPGIRSGVDEYTLGHPFCVPKLPIIQLLGGEFGGELPVTFEWVLTRLSDGKVFQLGAGTSTTQTTAAGTTVFSALDWDPNATTIEAGDHSLELITTDGNGVKKAKKVTFHFILNPC